MMVKVDIYRKFTNALAVTVIVSVGWICYEVTWKFTYVDLPPTQFGCILACSR